MAFVNTCMHIFSSDFLHFDMSLLLLSSDFLHFDMSLLLLTVTLRGVSNKHCLLSLFSFVSDLVGNPEDRFSHKRFICIFDSRHAS